MKIRFKESEDNGYRHQLGDVVLSEYGDYYLIIKVDERFRFLNLNTNQVSDDEYMNLSDMWVENKTDEKVEVELTIVRRQ